MGSKLGTCEASRFDSNSKVSGRFEIFESAALAVVPQTTLTACSTKKVFKNFNRCAVVIEIYFMFMMLCLCSKREAKHCLAYYGNQTVLGFASHMVLRKWDGSQPMYPTHRVKSLPMQF